MKRPGVVGPLAFIVAMLAAVPVIAGAPQAPSASALAATVHAHAAQRDADRQVIRDTLQQSDVRHMADKMGVDLDRVDASLDTLGQQDLARAATAARQLNQEFDRRLIGGSSTVTISSTTLIIGLLILILLIVAVR